MKKIFLTVMLASVSGFAAACSTASTQTPANANTPNKNTTVVDANKTAPVEPPTIAPGHGKTVTPPADSKTTAAPSAANSNSAELSAEETALVPKPLQDKVLAADAKAKAANANAADKVAAAKLFIERGNIFYEAGQPRLYKYALRDFRRAAKLDPSNAEAAGKRDQIVQIYQSMNRPVPTLGEDN